MAQQESPTRSHQAVPEQQLPWQDSPSSLLCHRGAGAVPCPHVPSQPPALPCSWGTVGTAGGLARVPAGLSSSCNTGALSSLA